tara:strand:- start:13779 stop:14639 length:861 start_codon:yes stop_codon:yes gene_type:complete
MGNFFLNHLAITFLFSISTLAQTMVISDIDDTVKISHVLNKGAALANTVQIKNHFYGMGELFTAVQKSNPDFSFVYLSAAPEKLMENLHVAFLKLNGFPTGEVVLRESIADKDFKVNAIRALIAQNLPQRLILIGDNGERDPYIYEQIRAEYPNIQTDIYIHQIYSYRARKEIGVPPQSAQRLFVTSIDLARKLVLAQDLPQHELEQIALATIPKLFKQNPKKESGPIFIPAWVDCRDYFGAENLVATQWNLDRRWPWQPERPLSEWLAAYDHKLSARCHSGPLAD